MSVNNSFYYSNCNSKNIVARDRIAYDDGKMTVGERIDERLTALRMSQARLARLVGISQPTVHALVRGDSSSSKHLHRIAAELETSPAWLAGETDDMTPQAVAPSAIDALAEKLDLAIVPELEFGYSMGGGSVFDAYKQTGIVPFQKTWLKSFTAGAFTDLFVARGEGDSMQPTLLDGDLVLIDSSQNSITKQDRIWAVSYGDLAMIKRVRRLPDGTYNLLSDNPSIPDIHCADDEMHVVGRVVWIGRRI